MDVTAILDESGNQLFSTAKILNLSTSPTNTYAQHPVEDGTVVSDNKITNQVRISVTIILDGNDYQEVYKSIQNASNNDTKLSIQTRVSTYNNMYIEAYPSEESASIFDTVSMSIDFVEQITGNITTSQLSPSDVASQSDVDTVDRGEQLPKEPSSTAAQRIAEGLSGIFGG